MSSILEALRKLEEEKAARRGVGGAIAGKVTATSRRGRRRPAWLVPAGMAAVAVVAVLATYAAMGGFSPRPGGSVAGKVPEPASVTVTVPAPRVDAQAGMQSDPPRVRPQSPVRREAGAGADAPQLSAAAKHSSIPSPSRPETTPAQAAPPPETAASTAPPELNVTGIAWQKDSASRLAVVNGASIAEGASISGARVKEILPDRIIFSFNNKEFEVYLGKGE
ncbi:MAG TPA: general secretion pathway protein GspB [Geobacteraceae bacterium]